MQDERISFAPFTGANCSSHGGCNAASMPPLDIIVINIEIGKTSDAPTNESVPRKLKYHVSSTPTNVWAINTAMVVIPSDSRVRNRGRPKCERDVARRRRACLKSDPYASSLSPVGQERQQQLIDRVGRFLLCVVTDSGKQVFSRQVGHVTFEALVFFLRHLQHAIQFTRDEDRELEDARAVRNGVSSQFRSKFRYQLMPPRKPDILNCAVK